MALSRGGGRVLRKGDKAATTPSDRSRRHFHKRVQSARHFHGVAVMARLLVLYGSATGNSEAIAERIHEEAEAHGFASELSTLNGIDRKTFAAEAVAAAAVVVVTSTTGNGDPPDNAGRTWRWIRRRTHDPALLAGMTYALLGLGDSNYDKFCFIPKGFDKRFEQLGAARACACGYADEAVGLEDAVEGWLAQLWPALQRAAGIDGGNSDGGDGGGGEIRKFENV